MTPDGTYEFLRMPFGMVNSGATLTRVLKRVIGGLKDTSTYMDDILVHSSNWASHLNTLESLFFRLKEAGLTARPTKCALGVNKIEFLGHEVGSGVVTPQNKNIDKVRESPQPRTKKEVRSFLGLTGFYRDFIPNYATIAAPLTDLTKKTNHTW